MDKICMSWPWFNRDGKLNILVNKTVQITDLSLYPNVGCWFLKLEKSNIFKTMSNFYDEATDKFHASICHRLNKRIKWDEF